MTAKRVSNPPNPWVSAHVEWLDEVPVAEVEVFEEEAKSVLAENKSPDLGFRWSVNPYRGCHHACAYCYARPSHQYLGFGAGTDFDRKIVVKVNAPAVLARELSRPKWKRELVVFSGNTDCYQPLDAHYGLTRGCLEACLAHGTPVGVITKGALVRRDVDVLAKLARGPGASAAITIPFANEDVARRIEPGAPSEILNVDDAAIGDRMGLDIGPKTMHAYADALKNAHTVVWNGPMGVFEIDQFARGTIAVAHAVAAVRGTSIIGGGDSIAAVKKAGLADHITHISTGGGASLEWLGGRTLPGVAVLPEA